MRFICYLLSAVIMMVACTPRGFRHPPADDESFTSKGNPTAAQVRKALFDCGDGRPKRNDESQTNADAKVIECMFNNGYFFKSGWGGPCSMPEYRLKLLSCKNAPIRPRQGYYGE